MATNYTGNKTATQSPSPTPNPAISPILSLPADGDPLNVASIAQALKVLADLGDWLTKPEAKSADYASAIMRFRSALGHTRSLIDHLGLPGGRIIQWDEPWDASAAGSVTGTLASISLLGNVPVAYNANFGAYINTAGTRLNSASTAADLPTTQVFLGQAGAALVSAAAAYSSGALGNRWFLKGQQTTGIGYALTLMYGTLRLRGLSIECGDSATDYSLVWRYGPCQFHDDLAFAVEFDLNLAAANIPHREVLVGFADAEHVPGALGNATNYAVFELGTSGNWFCSHGGSGGHASVDSTVAAVPGTWTRFRIEFQGANVADDSTRAIRYYINGTLVQTATTNLPDATAEADFNATVQNVSGGSSGLSAPPGPMLLGVTRFRGSTYAADVV